MIEIIAEARKAWASEKEKITTGSKGIKIHFTFTEEWDGLQKIAVFRAYDSCIDIPVDESETVLIPIDVLHHSGVKVFVGIYGTDTAGNIIIPTVYAELGTIYEGVSAEMAKNYDVPSPALSAQILEIARQAQYAAAIAVSARDAATITFAITEGGHLIETRTNGDDPGAGYAVDLGIVSSYGMARERGYTGTKDEFIELLLANKAVDEDVQRAIEIASGAGEAAAAAAESAANAEAAASGISSTVNALSESVTQLGLSIETKQPRHKTATVTLDSGAATWSKSVSGVTADNTVICSPTPSSFAVWGDAGIRCSGQSEDTLTFTADSATTEAVTVNVLILD